MFVEESPHRPPSLRPSRTALAAEPILRSCFEDEVLGRRVAPPEPVLYSIRLPAKPSRVSCSLCASRFHAAGPTGYADDRPICDTCLLRGAEELGMVLEVIAVVRIYAGDLEPTSPSFWGNLAELGAFVRVYDRYAYRSGPARPILDGGAPAGRTPGEVH